MGVERRAKAIAAEAVAIGKVLAFIDKWGCSDSFRKNYLEKKGPQLGCVWRDGGPQDYTYNGDRIRLEGLRKFCFIKKTACPFASHWPGEPGCGWIRKKKLANTFREMKKCPKKQKGKK